MQFSGKKNARDDSNDSRYAMQDRLAFYYYLPSLSSGMVTFRKGCITGYKKTSCHCRREKVFKKLSFIDT